MKHLILPLLLLFSLAATSQTLVDLQEQRKAKPPLLNNHELIPPIVKEFYDGARYYKVAYHEINDSLEAVYFVKADLAMLGEIAGDGKIILLNEELIKYPNLARVVLFRQFGNLYGLKSEPKKRSIMGELWELNEKNEEHALYHRQFPHQRENFFEKLAEKHPIKKRL